MNGRLAHQLTEDGVTVVLRPAIGSPSSLRVSPSEAKRFAWSILADVDPDGGMGAGGEQIEVGAITLAREQASVMVSGRAVHLTVKEFAILELLAVRRGQTLSKEAIFQHLYQGRDEPELKIIDVFLCKIRNKLRPHGAHDQIETSWGRGYRLVAESSGAGFAPNAPTKPAPVQEAILGRLQQGAATFPQLWSLFPIAAESTVRNAIATLLARGEVCRSGEPRGAVYSLPSPDPRDCLMERQVQP